MPLELIRAMNVLEQLDVTDLTNVNDTDAYLLIKDPDPSSDFFFSVLDIKIHNDSKTHRGPTPPSYLIKYKPVNDINVSSYELLIAADQLKVIYAKWKRRINEYSEHIPQQLTNDPILEQYEEDFFSDFEMTDEDADIHSFSTKEQLRIDAYLTYIIKRLEVYKEKSDTKQAIKDEVEGVIDAAKVLQETQTKLTKNQVAKRLANILAQCKKVSLKVLGEVKSEVVKGLVKGVMEDPQGFFNSLGGLLS